MIFSFPENYLLIFLEVFHWDAHWIHLREPGKHCQQGSVRPGWYKTTYLFSISRGESKAAIEF